MIDMHKIKEWSDIVLKLMTILAIPIGGWWAYHNFSITATSEWNPEIRVTTEVFPYDLKSMLLVIHARPKNIGKVPIELYGNNKGDITVQIEELPSEHEIGRIGEKELVQVHEIKSLVAENNGEYDLQPGVEYDDLQYFVVPRPEKGMSKFYVISADFNWPYEGANPDEGYAVSASTVVQVK